MDKWHEMQDCPSGRGGFPGGERNTDELEHDAYSIFWKRLNNRFVANADKS